MGKGWAMSVHGVCEECAMGGQGVCNQCALSVH